jgi:hypothetical protein
LQPNNNFDSNQWHKIDQIIAERIESAVKSAEIGSKPTPEVSQTQMAVERRQTVAILAPASLQTNQCKRRRLA